MMLDKKEFMVYAQVFTLVLAISAFGYFASESFNANKNRIMVQEVTERGKSILLGLLKIFNKIVFSESGFVSAIDTVSTCVKTKDGKICQEYPTAECGPKCETPCILSSKENIAECKEGTCYDTVEGRCNLGAPKAECESNGGKWFADRSGNVAPCKKGCCLLGNQAQFITEQMCTRIGSLWGLSKNFTFGIKTEMECLTQAKSQIMGACIKGKDNFGNNMCLFGTKTQCVTIKGEFYEGLLCSNPNLKTTCQKQQTTGCVGVRDEVFWFDSCGNRENIYDANKEISWNNGKVLGKEKSCELRTSTDPTKYQSTCGNCDYNFGSVCGNKTSSQKLLDSSQKVVCRDMSCVDDKGRRREHGEAWCVYQGSVGVDESKDRAMDTVGSSQFVRSCIEGEIITTPCEIGRKQICVQGEINRGGKKVITAQCSMNTALDCMSYNDKKTDEKITEACNANPDCFIKRVNVDDYFDFKMCVSKFPVKGGNSCSVGTTTCKVYYKKALSGRWNCIENCKCNKNKFVTELNDLCISLSDCGAKSNYMGEVSENYDSDKGSLNSNYISDLSKYSNAMPSGFFIPSAGRVDLSGEGTIDTGKNNADTSRDMVLAAASCVAGAVVGAVVGFLAVNLLIVLGATCLAAGPAGWIVFAIIVIIFVILTYGLGIGKIKSKKVKFTCSSWEPPVGGDDCKKCGSDGLPCSEYACWSLGTQCKLINKDTGEEKCIFDDTRDVVPPQITPDQEVLGNEYKYTPAQDPRLGTSVRAATGDCIPAYTTLNVGILLDKLAQCKYSTKENGIKFDDGGNPEDTSDEINESELNKFVLSGNFGDSRWRTNHSMLLPMPDLEMLGASSLRQDATADFNIFVNCRNTAGKMGTVDYKMSFCIKAGADVIPPVIKKIFGPVGKYVAYNTTNQDVILYMSEPSECRWDSMNKNFTSMANNFSCDTNFDEQSIYDGGIGWRCKANMPIASESNAYYIGCKDRPWDEDESTRNTMENYLINMTKTKPFEITSVKPDGETVVFGVEPATVEMVVETRGGLDDTALCWYSFDTGNLSGFYETGGSVHKNQFDQIMTGHYNIQIRCEDIVGDIAEKDIEFWAELDSAWPKISRVYRVGGNLIVKTDEDSSCAISKERCDFVFENGTMMNGAGKEHSLQISSGSVYYVQCRDAFGNHEGGCDLTLRTTGTTSNFNIHI